MCLWDYDTRLEETLASADVDAALEGNIFKHSRFFYEQKLSYTLPLLEAPNAPPERFDDAAVAWDKLGQPERALRLIEAKEARFPGLYTTLANRGTFLAHAGKLEEGLIELREAVRVNPDAHFGREHYQIRLIESLLQFRAHPELEAQQDLLGFPLASVEDYLRNFTPVTGPPGRGPEHRLDFPDGVEEDVFEALVGIIRFGNGDAFAPIWFSLGVAFSAALGRHFRVAQAMRCAERLGHPRARLFGELAVLPTSWEDAITELDQLFEEGQERVHTRQAEEDERLRSGLRREVFGY